LNYLHPAVDEHGERALLKDEEAQLLDDQLPRDRPVNDQDAQNDQMLGGIHQFAQTAKEQPSHQQKS